MKKVKLAIDFGNANMKMIGVINNKEVKKIVRSLARTESLQEYRTVTYNDKKVYFGVGDPLVSTDKTKREYVLESIFLATHEIYGGLNESEFEIQLAIGLPITQYKSNKLNDYKSELNEFLNKKLNAVVDGKNYTITISLLKVYAEGFSGFVSLVDDFPKEKSLILIDIGYKTTDILGIKNDFSSGKLIIDNYDSIETGMLEIFNLIRKQFINDTGMLYPVETIENSMLTKTTLTVTNKDGSKEVDTRQWLKYGVPVLKNIFSKIEAEIFPDMKTRRIYLIGGGVEFIYRLLQMIGQEDKYSQLDVQISTDIEQSMFANVVGYLQQLERDVMKIVESEDVFVPEKKLKGVALAEE